ncbi:unnamed protein product [Ixodes persulcatus]
MCRIVLASCKLVLQKPVKGLPIQQPTCEVPLLATCFSDWELLGVRQAFATNGASKKLSPQDKNKRSKFCL